MGVNLAPPPIYAALANNSHILSLFPHLQTEHIDTLELIRRLNGKVLNTSYSHQVSLRASGMTGRMSHSSYPHSHEAQAAIATKGSVPTPADPKCSRMQNRGS